MRDFQNIRDVAGLHPDILGFIFFRGSKRFTGDDFKMPDIPADIEKAGIFVNENPSAIIEISKKHRLQIIQLHGSETPEECREIKQAGFKVFKAFGLDNSFSFDRLSEYTGVTDGFVFDTKTDNHGGSGKKFRWEILQSYRNDHPFLLSGGIRPGDAEALKLFNHPQCMGFDINSGFESQPGLKDVRLLEQFFRMIRE